ncbi:BTAD domain-containing putative transcriptional regulator [Streptomyces sp. 4F14]|uniref:BTAD domain-containing putative transcriptional regulator n=1 Tax=Streptomyces sp. 4F14 TaxID=3394380 RepID=UPI003A8A6CC7
MSARNTFLIEAKVRAPQVRETAIARPRVSQLVRSHLADVDVLWVTATAGAGKTTAVVHALAGISHPVAWMRLDSGEVMPGRFLVYLEQALLRALPEKKPVVESALEQGISHRECAALLAQSIDEAEVVLVLDEVERIEEAPAVQQALSSLLTYAATGTKTILVSRREVELGLARAQLDGHVGYLGEADLAFSVAEAGEALARLSLADVDAQTAVDATGGWVTGVLFESWRSAEHVHGAGGEVDPLSSYLSSEIMGSLDPDLRGFLVTTAVLDVVTPDAACHLGIAGAGELMSRLRTAHLPVVFEGPLAMRCHTRFREYLLDRWQELRPSVRADIHLRHGHLLAEQRRWEDAVGEFIAAGDIAQAEDTAERVIIAIARRLDFELVERWLGSFRAWRVECSPVLTAAELLVAFDREQYGRASRAADRLVECEDKEAVSDPRLLGAMAWIYFANCRIDDAYRVLDDAPDDAHTRAIRFCIGVEMADDDTHYRDRPPNTHTELDGPLARVDVVHGRFAELLSREDNPQEAVRLARAGAMAGLGRLEEAWSQLSFASSGWTGIRTRAELLAASGRPEEAWSELIAGRERLSRSESPLYRMFALLTEAMLALRFRRDTAQARAALRAVLREPTAQRWIRVREQGALWQGLIALFEDDTEEAVLQLREAVTLMTKWDRRPLLPTAAVYLAEAEWRAGNEERSDRAADLALSTASAMRSAHALGRALEDFPAVLSRRLDIERDPDGRWHILGRTLIVHAESPEVVVSRPSVSVDELERPAILIGERRHEPKLTKTVELLSYLAVEGPEVSRADLITALFDSKNDKSANAYLRMAAGAVRQLTGDPDCILSDGSRIRWNQGTLSSTFVDTRTRHQRMRLVTGHDRLQMALDTLHRVAGMEMLPGARSPWVTEHRERWATLIRDIRHTAAEAAYETADYGIAHRLVQQVLAEDPYRERAWRLAMKVASAVGDTDRVIAAYRGCATAMRELRADPSSATRALFDRLRT